MRTEADDEALSEPGRQRVDKWLWHARVARTRTAAAALAASGHVRINGARIDAASRAVKPGDILTVALDSRVRVLKVLGFAERRGNAAAAAVLFEEQVVSAPTRGATSLPAPFPADQAGRPTKRDRRAIARFTRSEEA